MIAMSEVKIVLPEASAHHHDSSAVHAVGGKEQHV